MPAAVACPWLRTGHGQLQMMTSLLGERLHPPRTRLERISRIEQSRKRRTFSGLVSDEVIRKTRHADARLVNDARSNQIKS